MRRARPLVMQVLGCALVLATLVFAHVAWAAGVDPRFERAQAAAREGKYRDALKAYAAILRMRGEDAAVRHNRALIYLELQDAVRAQDEAEWATKLAPKEGRYRVTLAVSYLSLEHPKFKKARSALKKAVRLLRKRRDYPGLGNAYYNLGIIAQRHLKLEEARRYYRQALQYNPADKSARQALEVLEPPG